MEGKMPVFGGSFGPSRPVAQFTIMSGGTGCGHPPARLLARLSALSCEAKHSAVADPDTRRPANAALFDCPDLAPQSPSKGINSLTPPRPLPRLLASRSPTTQALEGISGTVVRELTLGKLLVDQVPRHQERLKRDPFSQPDD